MIYVCSDLHGFSISEFRKLLRSVGFNDNDWLYIIGDVADYGTDGAEYYKWLLEQGNVQLLLGNHEQMLLGCSFIFENADDFAEKRDPAQMKKLGTWMANGGEPTVKALRALQEKSPEQIEYILDYLRDECPRYETLETARGDFLLVHGGLGNFSPDKDLSAYTGKELLWYKTNPSDKYFDDIKTVVGHVPTFNYGDKYRGRCLKTPTWINIDAGCEAGLKPMLLRLDDLKEFYL